LIASLYNLELNWLLQEVYYRNVIYTIGILIRIEFCS
jgi:hypothetical protein